MATAEEMIALEQELRKEIEGSSQLETKKEEVKEEDTKKEEVKPEDTKEEETTEEVVEDAEDKKEEFTPSERVQARFDALTERLIEKDRKLAELEKKISEVRSEEKVEKPSEVTKEQVLALLSDESQKQYHPWAYQQLAKIEAKEAISQTQEESKKQQEKQSLAIAVQNSYKRAVSEYPDMLDETTPLWKKANEIYVSKKLENDPDGQYIAAVLASKLVEKNADTTSTEVLEKRLAKETGKKSLASSTRKSISTFEDKINKLEKEAFSKGFNSPEYLQYLKALEEDRLARKKK